MLARQPGERAWASSFERQLSPSENKNPLESDMADWVGQTGPMMPLIREIAMQMINIAKKKKTTERDQNTIIILVLLS